MNLRNTGVLLGKELIYGPKNFIFIMAVVIPIILSLVVTAVFGSLFAETPRLGIYDAGNSTLADRAEQVEAISVSEFALESELIAAVESGALDMGIILPAGFDEALQAGEITGIDAYIWGESLAKDRTLLGVTIASLARDITGGEIDLTIEMVSLGEGRNIPWEDRLLPLIVLMGMFFGGTMLPATSIINEKQKKTISALTVTPATLGDIFMSKALMGVIISLVMGIVVLAINQAFGAHPWLLVGVMALGSIMAVEFGLILGMFARDISTLFATIKSLGILLYAPAFVYMFPALPEWVGRVFPTFYIIQPVVAVSQRGEGWSGVALEVAILAGLVVVIAAVVALRIRSIREKL